MKRTILFLLLLSLPMLALGFGGDYVWEEKFQKHLPKAQAGDVQAQYQVGLMYAKGRGTPRDSKSAFEWFEKAAKQGHTKSMYKVGYAYLKGQGVSVNPQKAHKWMEKSANKGYERAHFYMGEIYELGNGVDKDLETALSWYEKSSQGGFNPATSRVKRVSKALAKQESIRAETAARRQLRKKRQVVLKAKAKPSARKVSMKGPPRSTRETLLKGGWKKRNKPSEYLPSKITKCKKTGRTLECLSKKQTRNIGVADISYTTKAVVFSIKPTGEFKISYRNKVLDVQVTDPEFAESGAEVPVKKGWQDAEHSLSCQLDSRKSLTCKKDKLRTIKFRR